MEHMSMSWRFKGFFLGCLLGIVFAALAILVKSTAECSEFGCLVLGLILAPLLISFIAVTGIFALIASATGIVISHQLEQLLLFWMINHYAWTHRFLSTKSVIAIILLNIPLYGLLGYFVGRRMTSQPIRRNI